MRISLVRYGEHLNEAIAKVNVLKFVCYGVDERFPTQARIGDCHHPCNAREECHYQSGEYIFLLFNQ